MARVEVVGATPEQAALVRDQAREFEAQAREFFPAIAHRYYWWVAVHDVLAKWDLDPAQLIGEDVVKLNHEATAGSVDFVRAYAGLDTGSAELVGMLAPNGSIGLGCALKGTVPRTMGGAFALVAGVLVVGAIASVSGWLAVDAWAAMRKAEEVSRLAQSANEARKLELLRRAQEMGPDAVKQITDALKQVDQLAQRAAQGPIDKLVSSVTGAVDTVTDAVRSTADSGWIVLLLLLALSRRGMR